MLEVNAVLTTLDLRDNIVGENVVRDKDMSGVLAIADALKVNAVLTSLDLCNNGVGPEGAKALADALRVNASLKEVRSACSRSLLHASLSACLLPAQLILYNSHLGDEGEAAIKEAARGKEGFKLLI